MKKWSRKTKEFEYADYIYEDLKIRDMQYNDKQKYLTHIEQGGKKTEYWALLDKNENILGWFTTVKKAKEFAEII